MKAIDTNILVYAHRPDTSRHAQADRQLRTLTEGTAAWALPAFVIGEFLRVVTNPRFSKKTSTLEQAIGYIDGILDSPSVHVLYPGEGFWEVLKPTIIGSSARGNMVFDALIVALCREHGVDEIVSEDRDLDKFEGIRVIRLEGEQPPR